jgi:hypothetical protein
LTHKPMNLRLSPRNHKIMINTEQSHTFGREFRSKNNGVTAVGQKEVEDHNAPAD